MAKPKKDALDQLAAADPREVIALLLWKDRHRNPDMAVQITEKDIVGFRACVNYLEVEPEVAIFRPPGRPAQAGIPAAGNRRATPARPAEPPRPFVSVNLVAKDTMNAIKPIESNEEDAKLSDQGNAYRRAKDLAPSVANTLARDVNSGQFSTATILEAAQLLTTLARA